MSIIIAILIFSLIVLFHELGHFLLAKRSGIRVNEFSLGMGPKLLSFQKGETAYCLKLLPFGGSCMMEGEDEASGDERAFNNKSVWARISVVAAGPVFNFILALIFSMVITGWFGYDRPVISELMEDYPAQEAGLEPGDQIVSINGKHMHLYREISLYLQLHQGIDVDVVYLRDGEKQEVTITPRTDETTGVSYIGIIGGAYEKGNLLQVCKYGFFEVKYYVDTTYTSLKMLVTGELGADSVSGPVGIVSYIGDTYEASASYGFLIVLANMLNIAILLSANLGVMNLLPIPALDGGRLLLLLAEAITGKRIPPDKEGFINLIGFAFLMALMVFVMFNDIRHLF